MRCFGWGFGAERYEPRMEWWWLGWLAEGRSQLEWRMGCLGLLDQKDWLEALLLAHIEDNLNHKSLWVVEAAQTMGEMDLIREEVFQSQRLLYCPFES